MDWFSWPKATRWVDLTDKFHCGADVFNEQGKDEIFLCHASAFDVYTFSRAHKSPKPFVFALKSREFLFPARPMNQPDIQHTGYSKDDAPSLFEDQADYLHVFSCDVNEG